jgi:large subunit ribosomal protein L2
MVKVVHPHLHKGAPVDALTESKKRGSGRNHNGHITMRHKGGGHKQHYRIVDFKRNKDGIVAGRTPDTNQPQRSRAPAIAAQHRPARRRSARRCRVRKSDRAGAAECATPGRHLITVEADAGKGCDRAVGRRRRKAAREGVYAQVRLRSGEIRKVHVDCRAVIGEVGNEEHNLRSIGKAGANRWRGIRPTVRGICMNPVDHPHGGRSNGGGHPVSPWGTPTKGYKTRNNKRTDSMIVRRRHATKG